MAEAALSVGEREREGLMGSVVEEGEEEVVEEEEVMVVDRGEEIPAVFDCLVLKCLVGRRVEVEEKEETEDPWR